VRRIVAAALVALAACSKGSPETQAPPASEAASPEGARLFASRCGGCHDLPDVRSRSDAEWASEVRRMVQQKGAKITIEEEALILRLLLQANGRN